MHPLKENYEKLHTVTYVMNKSLSILYYNIFLIS